MTMEGRLSSKAKVMENQDRVIAFENVIDACIKLEFYYESVADLGKLKAVSCELEATEENFNDTEQWVKGYLRVSPRVTTDISRSEPTGQSHVHSTERRTG